METVIDTARGGLFCYLCHVEIFTDEDLTILGTGSNYWPAHQDCYDSAFERDLGSILHGH